MTETQWLKADSPEAMLNLLNNRASARQLRLYAIGCCRRIWRLFRDERCRHAVDVAQRFVDGRASAADLAHAGDVVASVARLAGQIHSSRSRAVIGGAAWAVTRASAWVAAWDTAWDARMAARDFLKADWEKERLWQAELLRDIIGNPKRPFAIEPSWAWVNDAAVRKMAQVMYAEDRFGDLPILGDALEEAGCQRQDVLDHCRAKQPHYRGCWVVDAILQQEKGQD